MFGKKLSEYFQFQRWILILIAAVWLVRLVLSLTGGYSTARWVSINIVLLVGLVYYAVAVHTKEFGSYKQLLGVLFVQTAVAHLLIPPGIKLGKLTGTKQSVCVREGFAARGGQELG